MFTQGQNKVLRGSRIWLAVTLGSALLCDAAYARELGPGERVVVHEDSDSEQWTLQGATLDVLPGGRTQSIAARDGSQVTIDSGTVNSLGSAGLMLNGSTATIRNTRITATNLTSSKAESSYGLTLVRIGSDNGPSVANVSNSEISGVGRGVSVFDGSSVTLVDSSVKGNAGQDASGPISGGVGIVLGAGSAVLTASTIVGDNNGAVLFSDNVEQVATASTLKVDNGSHIIGSMGSAILVSHARGLDVPTVIDVNNGSSLHGRNGVILEVEKGAIADFNVDNSHLTGDVLVSEDSSAGLSLANNASLTGTITNATSLNVDSSSAWVMVGDSTVGKLGLNGGLVDLRGTSDGFHALNLGELSGAGTFALGTDLAAQAGDFINIAGHATGDHKLLVQNTGIDPLQNAAAQQLVHASGGDAQFSLVSDKVDFGTFAYELQQQENASGGADWSLIQTEEVSAASRSVIGLFSAAPTVWYGETSSLRSRMGEVRNGQAQGGGWMRAYGNKFNMSAGADVAYSQQQQGISFGADAPMKSNNGQWLVGLMGGYSKSDLDLKEGTTGKVDSYYVGAYSTWLADDGFYVDALIKANRFQNSSDVTMRDGQKSKGKYTNHGLGASLEAGKHIKLNDEWFVEPFAQVTGLWVSGQDYDLDNGMDASSNKADSMLGKVGTSVGRKFALKDGGFVQPYVKVAAAHEFVSNNQVNINGNRFNNDLSGTRGELGAGVAAQLTDKLQLHADFDYMKGNNIEQPWGVNVGLRYNW